MTRKILDCIVIGGGPGALVAAIYINRALKTNVLITPLLGGQLIYTDAIENWPGYTKISGSKLTDDLVRQLTYNGGQIVLEKVLSVKKIDDIFEVMCESRSLFHARKVLVCTGSSPKMLNMEAECAIFGKSLHICALCDGLFYRGKNTMVLGGGNKGLEDALHLAPIAEKVYLVHRNNFLKGEQITQDKLKKFSNIEIILEDTIQDIKTNGAKIENVVLRSGKILPVDGLFLAIGSRPNSGFVEAKKDPMGYLLVDENFETDIEGLYAAGEVCDTRYKQLTTTVGFATCAAINMLRNM